MGSAFAQALARMGCNIVVHYNSASSATEAENTVRLVTEAGSKAILVAGDLTKQATVTALFEKAKSEFGRVDIVINNAGKVIKRPFIEYTEDDYNQLFNINLSIRRIKAIYYPL